MHIFNQENTTFQSRNSTIRFADDLARKVNKVYPRISVSKFESYKSAKKYDGYMDLLWDKNDRLRFQIEYNLKKESSVKTKVEKILSCIKKEKLGNCGESTFIAFIASKINGIKDCKFAYLTSPKGYDLDHAVLLVEDKTPYIIDAWLGFADYIPNAIKKYQNEFRQCFDFKKAKTKKIIIKPDKYNIYNKINNQMTDKDLKSIKRKHSNLIINK